MTPEQAKALVISQCRPSGPGEPDTVLGALRPYRGLLPRACFHDLMAEDPSQVDLPALARRDPVRPDGHRPDLGRLATTDQPVR
jgi:hypothetical protein